MTLESIELLEAYKSLWSNRTLPIEENPARTLKNAIEKELMDEMTHPRLRKTLHEKFYLSVKRIVASSLNDNQKVNLVNYHLQIFEELKQGGSL
ncbi:MAG TPA: hypothetical protein VEY70_27255 [Metabacillus sp.]|nr:hypothetical protein [Metabacillus sp.]